MRVQPWSQLTERWLPLLGDVFREYFTWHCSPGAVQHAADTTDPAQHSSQALVLLPNAQLLPERY